MRASTRGLVQVSGIRYAVQKLREFYVWRARKICGQEAPRRPSTGITFLFCCLFLSLLRRKRTIQCTFDFSFVSDTLLYSRESLDGCSIAREALSCLIASIKLVFFSEELIPFSVPLEYENGVLILPVEYDKAVLSRRPLLWARTMMNQLLPLYLKPHPLLTLLCIITGLAVPRST